MTRRLLFAVCSASVLAMAAAAAQQGRSQQQGSTPVAAMFGVDQARNASLDRSFATVELPATAAAAFPARVLLSAGDLERAFEMPEFRPDAAIISGNTDLDVTAASPATQTVLFDRVRKYPDVMRSVDEQVAARRKQPGGQSPGSAEQGLLRIGMDFFVLQLARPGTPPSGPFPRSACLVATAFASGGGAVDRRELFVQDRVRKGIAGCLAALDAGGARSVVVPLMGASSSLTQSNDAQFEGQRALKECRLINSTAGIALGVRDFAASRRSLREIGVVQWDKEITGMFEAPKGSRAATTARAAYEQYAEQVRQAFRQGLGGRTTTAADLNGNCATILSGQ